VRNNNRNVGGGSMSQASGMLLVHGVARTVNIDEIKGIVIKAIDGVPLRIGDVSVTRKRRSCLKITPAGSR